jgi:hypothetical protein
MNDAQPSGTLHVSDLVVSLTPHPDDALRPNVRAGTLRLGDDTLRVIVAAAVPDDIPLPFGRLAIVDARWISGGVTVVARFTTRLLRQNATVYAALAPAPDGRLRARITKARAGRLPVTPLLGPVVERAAERPGLARAGRLALDIDIARLLRARVGALDWTAVVSAVTANPGELTIAFSPREDMPRVTAS